jgi:hypothetical protein
MDFLFAIFEIFRWGRGFDTGVGPISTGYGPINTGYGPINTGYGPIN